MSLEAVIFCRCLLYYFWKVYYGFAAAETYILVVCYDDEDDGYFRGMILAMFYTVDVN